MQIEITGEAEKLIQAVLASGKYASAEEFVAAMAMRLQHERLYTRPAELPKSISRSIPSPRRREWGRFGTTGT